MINVRGSWKGSMAEADASNDGGRDNLLEDSLYQVEYDLLAHIPQVSLDVCS